MRQLFAIVLEASRRDDGLFRRMGGEEQDALATDALGNPEILFSFARIVQAEDKLLAGEVQQIAGCLRVVPAGHLQQLCEDVDFGLVLEEVGRTDDGGVGTHV